MTGASLRPGALSELRQLHPVSHYDESKRLADLFLMNPDTNAFPLLEVNIPIHPG